MDIYYPNRSVVELPPTAQLVVVVPILHIMLTTIHVLLLVDQKFSLEYPPPTPSQQILGLMSNMELNN